MHSISDLNIINEQLIPLKKLADRELASIYGLSGMVYTPHFDAYMKVCIKRADILIDLKKLGVIPVSIVEKISASLDDLHKRTKHNDIVKYKGNCYKRRFSPLKLSKSGKIVSKWAKFWLLQQSNGELDREWETQVREVWPQYFVIRNFDI